MKKGILSQKEGLFKKLKLNGPNSAKITLLEALSCREKEGNGGKKGGKVLNLAPKRGSDPPK